METGFIYKAKPSHEMVMKEQHKPIATKPIAAIIVPNLSKQNKKRSRRRKRSSRFEVSTSELEKAEREATRTTHK